MATIRAGASPVIRGSSKVGPSFFAINHGCQGVVERHRRKAHVERLELVYWSALAVTHYLHREGANLGSSPGVSAVRHPKIRSHSCIHG